MSEIILCRSDGFTGDNVIFSSNGKLMAFKKERLKGVRDLFYVDRGNFFTPNALSSPVVVQIQVTNRCNLSCKHCYSHSGVSIKGEMSDSFIKELLTRLRFWGVLKIQWVGGEVFTRKNFIELVVYAKQLGFEQSLLTNGLFFGIGKKQDCIKKLWDCFYTIQVSVDDFGDNFNSFVGRKNVWGCLCDAITSLSVFKPNKKILSLATIVRKDNISSLSNIATFFDNKRHVPQYPKLKNTSPREVFFSFVSLGIFVGLDDNSINLQLLQ